MMDTESQYPSINHRKKMMKNGLASTAFFLLLLTSCTTVSYIFVSDQQEVELGNQIKRELLSDSDEYPVYNRNQAVVRYVDSIGQALVRAQSDRRNIPFTFTIIDKNVINAFAVPGGHVFVYRGLIEACRNEAELAAVLAHEIAHITMRHGIKLLIKQYGAALLIDIVIDDDNSLNHYLSNIAASMGFLKYSRNNEFEADSLAVEYSILANYNPTGMETFLTLLRDDAPARPRIAEIFSTHPNPEDRIERVKGIIGRKSQNLSDAQLFRERFMHYHSQI
ncbi:M48 family metallopeptidase [Chitinispirillales bacterium ANBcel5]|uniref:M48 family metallopeptidase n=1 Tax=Cellulosispirillum alkaliphilum TaxID=3039283 RepID=UPI002A5005D8|nr:M48 family metallopeptidase [Chitinispirillales bacterium ANBcel5]